VAKSKKSAGQSKGTGQRAGRGSPLPHDPDVLKRVHAALHEFTERLEGWLHRAVPAARARQLGPLRHVLQACRYLQRYVGDAPKDNTAPSIEKPSGLKVKPDLYIGLKQVDAEALAACIDELAESADALAPFEGQPFRRKPVVIGDHRERAKARRKAAAAKPTVEDATLAVLDEQAQELVAVFRAAASRFSKQLESIAPRRDQAKAKAGASLTPPQLAKQLGVKPDKVRTWIKSGQLAATNVAKKPGGRPRYRISEAAIEEFERKRQGAAPPTPARKRRMKSDDRVTKFF
jgi:excisionase family DNA binding protein